MTETLSIKAKLAVATLAIALASILGAFVADDARAVSVYVDGVYYGDIPDDSLNVCALGTSGCVPVKYK
jgi:hypothetical protein